MQRGLLKGLWVVQVVLLAAIDQIGCVGKQSGWLRPPKPGLRWLAANNFFRGKNQYWLKSCWIVGPKLATEPELNITTEFVKEFRPFEVAYQGSYSPYVVGMKSRIHLGTSLPKGLF